MRLFLVNHRTKYFWINSNLFEFARFTLTENKMSANPVLRTKFSRSFNLKPEIRTFWVCPLAPVARARSAFVRASGENTVKSFSSFKICNKIHKNRSLKYYIREIESLILFTSYAPREKFELAWATRRDSKDTGWTNRWRSVSVNSLSVLFSDPFIFHSNPSIVNCSMSPLREWKGMTTDL